MNDVNQTTAPAAVAPSSGANQSVVQDSTSQSSAGTLNTDPGKDNRIPESIPYTRFKEVNDELKQLKEMATVYQEFDNVLSSRQDLMKVLEVAAQRPEVLNHFLQLVDSQQNQGQQQQQNQQQNINFDPQVRTQNYVDRFKSLAKENKIPEELTQDYFNDVYYELLKINQDPLSNYNISHVDEAFKRVMDREERKFKARQANYITTKRQADVPASGSETGMRPMNGTQVYGSADARTNAFLQMLKTAV